jgi:hypothetical protein
VRGEIGGPVEEVEEHQDRDHDAQRRKRSKIRTKRSITFAYTHCCADLFLGVALTSKGPHLPYRKGFEKGGGNPPLPLE